MNKELSSEKMKKHERLKSKKEISHLFENGKWLTCGNLRIISTSGTDTKIGVSVSKRYFKKAVNRNRIKRLLRECIRQNKELYLSTFGENTHAMLFWTSQTFPQKLKEVEANFVALCEKAKKYG